VLLAFNRIATGLLTKHSLSLLSSLEYFYVLLPELMYFRLTDKETADASIHQYTNSWQDPTSLLLTY